MPYYDHIAKQWHATTGYSGGAFKELVLNDLLLEKLAPIDGCAILELGAGNGYFLPLLLRRFSGQLPARIVVTDQSSQMLELAQRHFRIPGAEYQCLDVRRPFPFGDGLFDLVIATMLFNEVPARDYDRALKECRRVLASAGRMLMTVTHPDFVASLHKRGLLKPTPQGALTMPGSGTLRLPVVNRSLASYRRGLQTAGFQYTEDEAYSTPAVLNLKAGLRNAWKVPLALIYSCAPSR
jgi:ubiquinone/menaquinone biosynthesis C-methylase UbiE